MNTDEPQTGIVCRILSDSYRAGTLRECKEVTLLVEGGVFEPDEHAPGVRLVRRNLFGREYLHAEPIADPPPGQIGYMAGGSFIWTSDGRFPNDYPISLHDYTETPTRD